MNFCRKTQLDFDDSDVSIIPLKQIKTTSPLSGKVYKLFDKRNNKILYVGSTKTPLSRRFTSHLYLAKRCIIQYPIYVKIRDMGVENVGIKLLEITTIETLRQREDYWILKLDTINNGCNLYRAKRITKESVYRKEYFKRYWKENKDKINEGRKERKE